MRLSPHSPESTLWVNFLYTGGGKSPAVTAKIKFIIGVIQEKKRIMISHIHTHAHTHEVDWKLYFPNFRMFRFGIFILVNNFLKLFSWVEFLLIF